MVCAGRVESLLPPTPHYGGEMMLLNSKYFYYLLHSYDIRKGFYGMGAGVRQGLNYAGVRKIMLTVPPESEQTAIAECLDRKNGTG